MSQIIKAFMGVFLTLFMAVTAMGILAAYMEVMNAQDMQARIVDEIENSDFNTGVVRQCFLQSEEAGYQLKVTFFNENSTVATVSQVSQIPYGMDGVDMAKIEMQFPFQVAFLGINRQHTFVSYAKEEDGMEQIIEEYGIGGILFVIGTGVLAGLGKVLQLIAGV